MEIQKSRNSIDMTVIDNSFENNFHNKSIFATHLNNLQNNSILDSNHKFNRSMMIDKNSILNNDSKSIKKLD